MHKGIPNSIGEPIATKFGTQIINRLWAEHMLSYNMIRLNINI